MKTAIAVTLEGMGAPLNFTAPDNGHVGRNM
jgi:hypothetical protein